MSSSEVLDEEELLRRIHPTQVKDCGGVSSAAFTDAELSVNRASLTSVEETLKEHPSHGVASFVTRVARELGQEVLPDPALFNPAHALVKGKKTKSVQRRLARACRLVRQPSPE